MIKNTVLFNKFGIFNIIIFGMFILVLIILLVNIFEYGDNEKINFIKIRKIENKEKFLQKINSARENYENKLKKVASYNIESTSKSVERFLDLLYHADGMTKSQVSKVREKPNGRFDKVSVSLSVITDYLTFIRFLIILQQSNLLFSIKSYNLSLFSQGVSPSLKITIVFSFYGVNQS
ncbi:hypothetical protein PsalN5692_03413 [Piscirickettsia salmonis]|uniref:hypothetical protein n=1 Tax=Piscirickettsia salmonis TaxID=1238 RepID=UPI0012B775C4|nr:hypothetical protein [Piscirickettsia salmonis]QGP51913.1 hypothetical protein PsalN5692_03413 [Piscirickettsia salmonis]